VTIVEQGWGVVRDFMDVLAGVGRKFAIYRGQPSAAWGLTPSIYRPGALGINHPRHLLDWKKRASRFASPIPRDDVEWLILAQHYGLATALLDWTTSPLVALFFACDGEEHRDVPGAVWWTMQNTFVDANETLMIDVFGDGATRTKPFLINAIGRNVRSTAQDSLLSLHTRQDYQTLSAERIFTVEPNDKSATLTALEKLGFSGDRLHFDITRLVDRFKSEMAGRRVTVPAAVTDTA
jgi:hypothetical protein